MLLPPQRKPKGLLCDCPSMIRDRSVRSNNSSNTDELLLRRLSISRLATAQAGCITARQILDLGLSRGYIQSNVRSGKFNRVFPGVFAMAGTPVTQQQRCMAALLFSGEDSALSHLTAAIMRKWWKRTPLKRIDVTSGSRITNSQLSTHLSRHWNPATDIESIDGLRFTTPERMVLDLGSNLSRFQLTNVIKEAAFWGKFHHQRFEAEAARLNGRGGSVIARGAVKSYLAGCAGTRSALEDRFIELMQVNRLPMPDEAGCPIGPHEVDFVWFDRGLIIEVDGPGHRQPNSRKKDPRRDSDLRAAGYRVARFTNSEIDYNSIGMTGRLRLLVTH